LVFIRHLPHDLVAAFKATLQETQEADLLLHVVDVADAKYRETMDEVNNVLEEIEAGDIQQLLPEMIEAPPIWHINECF
jgi:GTPases